MKTGDIGQVLSPSVKRVFSLVFVYTQVIGTVLSIFTSYLRERSIVIVQLETKSLYIAHGTLLILKTALCT